jgi:hypothetical protein
MAPSPRGTDGPLHKLCQIPAVSKDGGTHYANSAFGFHFVIRRPPLFCSSGFPYNATTDGF